MKQEQKQRKGWCCKNKLAILLWSLVALVLVILFVIPFFWPESLAPDGYKRYETLSPGLHFFRDMVIAVGAVSGLAVAGWRSLASYRQAEAANKQAKIADKRHGSEALSRGMELLAKANGEKPAIEARIGGIYVLASLVKDDETYQYREEVMRTLVAYIHHNAQATARQVPSKPSESKPAASTNAQATTPPVPSKVADEDTTTDPVKRAEAATLGEDVWAAFAQLKELDDLELFGAPQIPREKLNFSYADFRSLKLGDVEWIKGPILRFADLSNVNLKQADMAGANLRGVKLAGANLQKINLAGADLTWADMSGADLRRANLAGARLADAKMFNAQLSLAGLGGASLFRANLRHANLSELSDARYVCFTCARFDAPKGEDAREQQKEDTFEFSVSSSRSKDEVKIWYDDENKDKFSGYPSLKPDDADWSELSDIISRRAQYDEKYDIQTRAAILSGILCNISKLGGRYPVVSEEDKRKLREEARKLLDKD